MHSPSLTEGFSGFHLCGLVNFLIFKRVTITLQIIIKQIELWHLHLAIYHMHSMH